MNVSSSELLSQDPYTTIINAGEHPGKREIRGAVRYRPGDLLEAEHLALPIAHESSVILYAEHGSDERLERIADKLRTDGFADVRVYEGTLAAYEQAGGATQDASVEQVVPPSQPDEVSFLDRRL
jgi:rhodanese-related sulfurtransferase